MHEAAESRLSLVEPLHSVTCFLELRLDHEKKYF